MIGKSIPTDYVGWTIPNLTSEFMSIGTSSDPYGKGLFRPISPVYAERAGSSPRTYNHGMEFKISNHPDGRGNDEGKFHPNHYTCKWLIKYR